MEVVANAYGKLQLKNSFYLERGPYTLVAVLDEDVVTGDPFMIKGDYIDLFSPELTYYSETSILPEKVTKDGYSFTCKSPQNTTNIVCLYLPKEYKSAQINCTDAAGKTVNHMTRTITAPVNGISRHLLWLTFENSPEGVQVKVTF